MIRALVSGVGGDVAQGVIRCLDKCQEPVEVFKISSSVEDSWLYCDDKSFISPRVTDSSYISFLIEFINKKGIDIFFPCIDSEIYLIAKNKNLIEEETLCVVATGTEKQIGVCDDK